MKRIAILSVWMVVGLLLSGCMTAIPKDRPTAVPPAPLPQPVVTAVTFPFTPAIRMPHTALHGRPPFDASFIAEIGHGLSGELGDCLQIIWDFGDGRRLSQPCPPPSESYTTLTAVHQYRQPDTYFVRVQMEMADDRVIESDKTQTVIVAEAQPVGWGGRLLYWLVWLAALTLAGAAAYWLSLLFS